MAINGWIGTRLDVMRQIRSRVLQIFLHPELGQGGLCTTVEKMTTSTFFSTAEDAANMHHFYASTFLPQIEAILATMELPDYVIAHVKQLLDYNIKGGKMLRGKMVCAFTRALVGHDWHKVAELAYLLAWCIELVQ